jgi:hypothetical protein
MIVSSAYVIGKVGLAQSIDGGGAASERLATMGLLLGHGRRRWERLRRPSRSDSRTWPATSGGRLTMVAALLTRVLPIVLDAQSIGN